ncbi:hypothetical protein HYY69_05250 [Candidatus Woesearchaeota archaeon]|nr:hypothetical protein [Candidatus Woesearchaeota archaeon]
MSNFKLFFRGFKKGTTLFGYTIAGIVNTLLLMIAYVLGVGITSIIAKICKKHFLELKLNKQAKTYWQDLNLKTSSREEYVRQF